MELLHTVGVTCIQRLQTSFKGSADLMLVMSHLGDPRNAFLIYFPIAYCLHRGTGARVLWLACISEWLNAHLKWIFHGDRPFWWVQESGLYRGVKTVRQYPLTCETGPGSPSGHAMVTASVVYCMTSSIIHHLKPRKLFQRILWGIVFFFLLAVNVSRVFIATHFPHQVVLGTLIGFLLAIAFERLDLQNFRLAHYLSISVFIPLSCIGLYYALTQLNFDPQWSIVLAKKWCKKASWVHLDTTPFNAIYRDAGSILGFGIASYIMGDSISSSRASISVRCLQLVLSIVACLFGENVKPVQAEPGIYYMITYLKFCFIVIVVCCVGWLQPGRSRDQEKSHKSKEN